MDFDDNEIKGEAGKSSSLVYISVLIYVWFFQHSLPLVSFWAPIFFFGGMAVASFIFAPIRYFLAAALAKILIKQGQDGDIRIPPLALVVGIFFNLAFFVLEIAASYFALNYLLRQLSF